MGDVSSTISNRQNFGAITVSVISVGAFSTPLTCNASPTLLVVIVLSPKPVRYRPSTLQEGRQNEGTAGGGLWVRQAVPDRHSAGSVSDPKGKAGGLRRVPDAGAIPSMERCLLSTVGNVWTSKPSGKFGY